MKDHKVQYLIFYVGLERTLVPVLPKGMTTNCEVQQPSLVQPATHSYTSMRQIAAITQYFVLHPLV